MTTTQQGDKFTIEIEAPANGKVGKSTLHVVNAAGHVIDTDRADLLMAKEREKAAQRIASRLGRDAKKVLEAIDAKWNELINERRRAREQAKAGSAEAVAVETVELLDAEPLVI